MTYLCPKCERPGIQADAYRYCTVCRAARQREARRRGFCCPQCNSTGDKHPNYRLCTVCASERIQRAGGGDLRSREEAGWMKGFSELSQNYLMRKLM